MAIDSVLEAQALDIRALSAALAPEILDYRYQQDKLEKMERLSGSLPQIVRVGEQSDGVDFLAIAGQLVGGHDEKLFSEEDMADIQSRKSDIAERVSARESEIEGLLQAPEKTEVEILPASESQVDPEGEQRLDEIRQSVTDERTAAQLAGLGGDDGNEEGSQHD